MLSDIEKQILIGELLGDGCLYKDKRCNNSKPYFRYTTKHLDYLYFLKKVLPSVSWGTIKKREHKKINKDGGHSIHYELFSHVSDEFEYFYNMFYLDCKKILPDNLLITPTILRHWYIGDGTFGYFSTGRNRRSWQMSIYSCCFENDKLNEIVIEQLKNVGINAGITRQKKYYRIRVSSYSIENFFKYIGECPVDCYSYKWNFDKYLKGEENNGRA